MRTEPHEMYQHRAELLENWLYLFINLIGWNSKNKAALAPLSKRCLSVCRPTASSSSIRMFFFSVSYFKLTLLEDPSDFTDYSANTPINETGFNFMIVQLANISVNECVCLLSRLFT